MLKVTLPTNPATTEPKIIPVLEKISSSDDNAKFEINNAIVNPIPPKNPAPQTTPKQPPDEPDFVKAPKSEFPAK